MNVYGLCLCLVSLLDLVQCCITKLFSSDLSTPLHSSLLWKQYIYISISEKNKEINGPWKKTHVVNILICLDLLQNCLCSGCFVYIQAQVQVTPCTGKGQGYSVYRPKYRLLGVQAQVTPYTGPGTGYSVHRPMYRLLCVQAQAQVNPYTGPDTGYSMHWPSYRYSVYRLMHKLLRVRPMYRILRV